MSHYKQLIEEAVSIEGYRKILAEVLSAAKIVEKDTAGQILININNGGITDIYRHVKVK